MDKQMIKAAIEQHGAKTVYDAASVRMSGDHAPLAAMGMTAKTIGDANKIMVAAFAEMGQKDRATDRAGVAIDGAKLLSRIGRPPLPPGEAKTARIELRLTPAHKAEFQALGGVAWLEGQIDAAKKRRPTAPTKG